MDGDGQKDLKWSSFCNKASRFSIFLSVVGRSSLNVLWKDVLMQDAVNSFVLQSDCVDPTLKISRGIFTKDKFSVKWCSR